jgi:thiamine biosynthesis lipoprotein
LLLRLKNREREKTARLFVSHFENVLGTSLEIKVKSTSEKQASVAEAAALKEIERIGKILSAYDAGSEFSQWLKTSGEARKVSPELFEVLSLFDQWRSRSKGALDASAQVVSKLWKEAAAKQTLPYRNRIEQCSCRSKTTALETGCRCTNRNTS